MAGIQLGSSFRLTSPVPHLANASFPDAPTRLAQGQLRHVSWRYSQDNPDAHYRIKPLAVCFLADGVTPAVQFDSWGTLEAHWRIMPISSDDLPESATPTNKYYTSARAALKADLVNGLVPVNQLPPYPTLTGGTAYTLPQAAANTLGGLKLGANLTLNATSGQVDAGATFTSITGAPADNTALSTALGLKVDKVTGLALSSNDYTSPEKTKLAGLSNPVPATSATAGVVKIGTGVTVAADGTISVAPSGTGATAYTLPQASPTVLGGLKLGNNLALNATSGQVDAAAATFLNILGQPSDNASLSTALYSRFNNRGAWAASTIYQPNDVVIYLGATYYNAGVAFTSGATFLASNWTAFFASGIKADLVTGVVPYVQLPTGMVMLKQQTGVFSYYTSYENAIVTAVPGDTMYFGPGSFGSASVAVHLQKSISVILDPGTTWFFSQMFLQTYSNTGDRLYVINGQGGGRLVGTIAFNDGSQVAALTLANLRHDGNVTHTSYLVNAFTEIPVKIKFDQVRSFAATGDYLSVLPRNGGFYYRALVIESYNSLHTVTAGSFINNVGSDGSTGAGNASLVRMHRSTIRCAATAPLIINADTAFVYDLSLVGYVGTLSAGIVNGTNYFFAGGATPESLSVMPWAASVVVDFNLETVRTMLATGNVAYGPSLNVAPLRTKEHYITNNTGAAITLSFPTTWTFFPGPAPTSLAAGKQAVLTLRSLGTTDATIKAAYVAQA